MRIFEFIEKSNQAEEPDEIFNLFCRACEAYGYDRIAFAATTTAAQESLAKKDLKPVIAFNFPDSWVHHYSTEKYYEIDPIILLSPFADAALVWDDIVGQPRLAARPKKMFIESREAGLHNGVSIPVHGPRGESCVVSLATERRVRDGPPGLAPLHLLAAQFYLAYSQLARGPQASAAIVTLTERERECLTWTARGKSAWAISMIIGVSEHTVNFHIKSVMRKLKTVNRIQTVAMAVRVGLIAP